MAAVKPLAGIRVADFTWVWAGPFATLQLAHLGADVIKIESRSRLDTIRGLPPYADNEAGINRAGYFNQYNQGKRSITLDLSKPEGLEIAHQIAAKSDVVTENFSAGVMDRLGLGYDALKRVKPDIIVVALSGYGSTGPLSKYISYGPAQVPMSGLAGLTGYAGSGASEVGISYGDPNAGVHGAFAVLAALYHRQQTGEGQYVDMSQWEASIGLVAEGLVDYAMNGTQPERSGNRDPQYAPHGTFRCAGQDGWISIAVTNEEEWRSLCTALGAPALASDARFTDNAARKQHEDALERELSSLTAERDRWELTRSLQAAGVPAFTPLSNKELAEDPHLNERDFFVRLQHPDVGVRQHPGIPWRMSDSDSTVHAPAPMMGQHTREVLREVVGLNDARIDALEAAGVL